MDYIKEAEHYLRNYRELKSSVKHAEREIAKLMWKSRPNEVGAVVNDVTGVSADNPGNTENEMYQLLKWQEIRDSSKAEIAHIEGILEDISKDEGCERYRDILEMWYVKRMDKEDIAKELNYSRRSIFYLRDEAIKKFGIRLFGIKMLEII